MGKRFLIDTSACSSFILGKLSDESTTLMSSLPESNISVVSRMELLSWKANIIIETAVQELVNVSSIFDLSEEIIQKTIEIRRKVKIKLPDAIIAATAIVNGFVLLSTNDKDFLRVPKLKYQSLN